MGLSRTSILVLAVVVALFAACTASFADTAPPSTDGWTLTPFVSGNSVTFLLGIDNMSDLTGYNGQVTKIWGDPTLADSTKFLTLGTDCGILQSLTVTVDGDPSISLEFDYRAGSSGDDVSFISSLLHFDAINPVKGSATAAITVTDRDGDGASAIGGFDGKMYHASYGLLPVAGMMTFADLVGGPVTAPMYGSCTSSETTDPIWQNIAGSVGDIQSEFGFHLSANDSASGTSFFQVVPVPEPGSMLAMLTGCIGFAGFIRRRRR